jgi:hypothetical protein
MSNYFDTIFGFAGKRNLCICKLIDRVKFCMSLSERRDLLLFNAFTLYEETTHFLEYELFVQYAM